MKKKIISTDWHFWHLRKRSPLVLYFYYKAPNYTALNDFKYYIKTNGSAVDHILTKRSELGLLRIKLWEKLRQQPDFVLKHLNNAYQQYKKDQKYLKKIEKTHYSTLDNNAIAKLYQEYVKTIVENYGPFIYVPLCIEPLMEEETKNILKKYFANTWNDYFNHIMTPVKLGVQLEERKSLVKIAIKQKLNQNIDQDIKEHVKAFSFLKEKGMFMNFYDEDYYQKRLQQIENPEQELKKLEEEEQKRKQVLEQIVKKIIPQDQDIIRTVNESIYFRSWRVEHIEQTSYYVQNMFKEIAKRLELQDKREVVWLLPDEITRFLTTKQKASKTMIEQRKHAFVYLTQEDSEDIVLQGKEAIDFFKKINIHKHKGNDIKGTPAYLGKVTGTVIVIHNKEDYKNIKNGEILVIHATSPDIVPYLTNIKAIITEEGGILSHAAVISREMKIPAINGTGNCTKILKTGEVVEVDAHKGIVRKLN